MCRCINIHIYRVFIGRSKSSLGDISKYLSLPLCIGFPLGVGYGYVMEMLRGGNVHMEKDSGEIYDELFAVDT